MRINSDTNLDTPKEPRWLSVIAILHRYAGRVTVGEDADDNRPCITGC